MLSIFSYVAVSVARSPGGGDEGDHQRDTGGFGVAENLPQRHDADEGRGGRQQHAHLRSLDELDGLLDRFLVYGHTKTSIVRSSPVPPRGLPLPG